MVLYNPTTSTSAFGWQHQFAYNTFKKTLLFNELQRQVIKLYNLAVTLP